MKSENGSTVSDSLQPHGVYSKWNSPDQNIGVGSCFLLQLMFPSPGDLPNPEIEPRSPILQVDSLPAEPQGKPKNTGVGTLSLLQGIFPTQGLNPGLPHCRWILYQLSHQGSPCCCTGILDILKAYHDCGYEGYIRPDHGRHLWDEGPGNVRPGYGLYDRALGIMYMLGVWDSLEKFDNK